MTFETDLSLVPAQLDALDALVAEGTLPRRAPAVSGWDVAQHAAHVALTAASIASGVKRLLRSPPAESGETAESARVLLESGEIPRGAGKAPSSLRRDDSPSPEEVRAAIDKARARWCGLDGAEAAVDAAAGRFPHPLLGPLTAREWIRFANLHGAHHLAIVGEVIAAAGD